MIPFLQSGAQSPYAGLQTLLNSPDLKGSVVGVIVTETDGRVLFERGADLRLAPASNQKLFTVAYALDRLGPEYRSATRFWADEDAVTIASDGTLDLSYADLKALAERIGRRPKVRLIQAYRRGRPGTWEIDDLPNRYAPSVTAFSCEKAGVELWADAAGEPEMRPAPLGVTFARPDENAPDAEAIAGGLRYDVVRGVIYRSPETKLKPGRVDTLAQPTPDLAAAALFGDAVERGGPLPTRAPDATLLTDPLLTVAGRCLPPSDNFLAESLFEMARTKGMPPEEWGRTRVGFAPESYVPKDGSGLSRRDVVTARAVARLLRWTRLQPWGAGYRAALARPGTGTLRARLKSVRFEGKTGTLTGVSSLSGYVEDAKGRTRVVSLLMNGYAAPLGRIHDLQDRFVAAVARLR